MLDDMLAADNAAGLNTRALLLVQKGEIKAEAYGQAMNAESRLLGWSMAKSLISIMLGNLEMRGLIDLGSAPGFEAWSATSVRTSRLATC
jgi:CubicO group peptidase (beta-lactamase class C family)